MINSEKHHPLVVFLIIISLLLILVGVYYQLYYDYKYSTFKLNDKEEITLEVGKEYKDPGVIAIVGKKDKANNVITKSNLNSNKLGNYEIKYTLKYKYFNKEKTIIRKIKVVDTTKPILTINCKEKVSIKEKEKFTMPTYKATDNVDGNITRSVKVKSNLNTKIAGTYKIEYEISDSSGNKTTKKITIYVKKKQYVVYQENNNIQGTFIRVSISRQTLNYYRNGSLKLSSPVVTGINYGTPLGSYQILSKSRNVSLKGPGYQSFVNYWMPFIGSSYGIHDATWRSSFGGNIYKTNGSHGCINMPYYKAQQLYNMVAIGTPVYING